MQSGWLDKILTIKRVICCGLYMHWYLLFHTHLTQNLHIEHVHWALHNTEIYSPEIKNAVVALLQDKLHGPCSSSWQVPSISATVWLFLLWPSCWNILCSMVINKSCETCLRFNWGRVCSGTEGAAVMNANRWASSHLTQPTVGDPAMTHGAKNGG